MILIRRNSVLLMTCKDRSRVDRETNVVPRSAFFSLQDSDMTIWNREGLVRMCSKCAVIQNCSTVVISTGKNLGCVRSQLLPER